MNVKIKRLSQSIPMPQYHTPGSAAFDLASSIDTIINPKEIQLIPTGLIIQAPTGHMLMLSSRSSLIKKKGLMLGNGIGIIDEDYCGPQDEIKIQLINVTDIPAEIKKGDRLAQGTFVPVTRGKFLEVETMEKADSRGGFGGTGGYAQ